MTTVFVVLNPVAGRTSAENVRKALRRHLDRPGWRLEVYETTGQDQIDEVVRAALRRGVDWVIAAGGDGTVSAVVDGLVNSDVPLGILPAGTGNVLSQELGIPQNVDKACQMLAGGAQTRAIDALQVGEHYYTLSVGTGLDAITVKATNREHKRRYGALAYVWSVLKALAGLQPHHFTLVVDGRTRRVRAADILLTNVSVLTRPIRWGPHIRPDDGQIDICIMRATNLIDILGVAWDILIPGRPRRDRNLRYMAAEHSILVFADEPLPVQGDGEDLGQTPIEARVVPAVVQVFVPNDQDQGWSVKRLWKNGERVRRFAGLPRGPDKDQG